MNILTASSFSNPATTLENTINFASLASWQRRLYKFSMRSSISIKYRSTGGRTSGVGKTGSKRGSEGTKRSPFNTSSNTFNK